MLVWMWGSGMSLLCVMLNNYLYLGMEHTSGFAVLVFSSLHYLCLCLSVLLLSELRLSDACPGSCMPHTYTHSIFSASICKSGCRFSASFPSRPQPMEVYVDDETKLTLHGLAQHYLKLQEQEKNRKLFELIDTLDFNQVCYRGGWDEVVYRFHRCLGSFLTLK